MIPGNLLTIEGVINVENRKMKINLGVCPGGWNNSMILCFLLYR